MTAINPLQGYAASPSSLAMQLQAITPNDSTDLTYVARRIYVGVGGDIVAIDTLGNTTTHKNCSAGSYIGDFSIARVLATGTTATNLIAYV